MANEFDIFEASEFLSIFTMHLRNSLCAFGESYQKKRQETGESKPKPEFDHDLLSGIEDQLTGKEKKGHYGKMISYILSTVKAGCSITKVFDGLTALKKMKDHVGKVETLLDNLIKTSHSKEDIIKEAQNFHAKNCTGVMDNLDFGPHIDLMELNTASAESEAEKIKTPILNVFKDKQREASDNLIINMAKANAVATTVQFVKIYFAWKTISAASNVIEDKNKFVQINKNLQKMETFALCLSRKTGYCQYFPND
ncbi:Hypothetical predicted protein [Paramuricea clavata]|uniref:Uncharacterized protein n=1 Tax=Paramuricea clavata TaxID=317549 RepID=A0A7D9L1N5_PARCT|nr:Hypothetical predicted protein [Paramuricea clavata]